MEGRERQKSEGSLSSSARSVDQTLNSNLDTSSLLITQDIPCIDPSELQNVLEIVFGQLQGLAESVVRLDEIKVSGDDLEKFGKDIQTKANSEEKNESEGALAEVLEQMKRLHENFLSIQRQLSDIWPSGPAFRKAVERRLSYLEEERGTMDSLKEEMEELVSTGRERASEEALTEEQIKTLVEETRKQTTEELRREFKDMMSRLKNEMQNETQVVGCKVDKADSRIDQVEARVGTLSAALGDMGISLNNSVKEINTSIQSRVGPLDAKITEVELDIQSFRDATDNAFSAMHVRMTEIDETLDSKAPIRAVSDLEDLLQRKADTDEITATMKVVETKASEEYVTKLMEAQESGLKSRVAELKEELQGFLVMRADEFRRRLLESKSDAEMKLTIHSQNLEALATRSDQHEETLLRLDRSLSGMMSRRRIAFPELESNTRARMLRPLPAESTASMMLQQSLHRGTHPLPPQPQSQQQQQNPEAGVSPPRPSASVTFVADNTEVQNTIKPCGNKDIADFAPAPSYHGIGAKAGRPLDGPHMPMPLLEGMSLMDGSNVNVPRERQIAALRCRYDLCEDEAMDDVYRRWGKRLAQRISAHRPPAEKELVMQGMKKMLDARLTLQCPRCDSLISTCGDCAAKTHDTVHIKTDLRQSVDGVDVLVELKSDSDDQGTKQSESANQASVDDKKKEASGDLSKDPNGEEILEPNAGGKVTLPLQDEALSQDRSSVVSEVISITSTKDGMPVATIRPTVGLHASPRQRSRTFCTSFRGDSDLDSLGLRSRTKERALSDLMKTVESDEEGEGVIDPEGMQRPKHEKGTEGSHGGSGGLGSGGSVVETPSTRHRRDSIDTARGVGSSPGSVAASGFVTPDELGTGPPISRTPQHRNMPSRSPHVSPHRRTRVIVRNRSSSRDKAPSPGTATPVSAGVESPKVQASPLQQKAGATEQPPPSE
eukprot:Rmarinus@m.18564